MFTTKFGRWPIPGDRITCEIDGITYVARLEYDPDSSPDEWDCYTPEQKKASDVTYFESALALVSKSASIDPALVFVGGISAGGWHSSVLLEDAPKRITGVVLLASGRSACRTTPVSGAPRGPFCMMGMCFDCLVVIDGVPNQQACMVTVSAGMRIEMQRGVPTAGTAPARGAAP